MSFKLSYESVILDSDDLKILESGEWFNDKLLTFIGEYLMNSMNSDEEKKKIHVFTPSETQMIRHSRSDEEVDMYFGMLECDEVPLVAWMVNNNHDVTRAFGGTHWSLLVFERKSDQFYHFDSSNGYNSRAAQILMLKARKLVKSTASELHKVDCIQQRNSSDCGLHVAQYLAALVEKGLTAITKLEKIEKTREYWRDLVVNFEDS